MHNVNKNGIYSNKNMNQIGDQSGSMVVKISETQEFKKNKYGVYNKNM